MSQVILKLQALDIFTHANIHIYIYYIYIYKYIYIYIVFITEGFFEVAIESWAKWDLNPRPVNSVQTL